MRAPEFWTGAENAWFARALAPLALAWAAAGRVRRALVPSFRAEAKVLCVGNLVAGGAGKTPLALDLARRILHRGHSVHILARGYGGTLSGPVKVDLARHKFTEVGDEALLLARLAATWVGRDRAAAARVACADGARVLVMDDGFQNPSLTKDFSVLAVDGAVGFGNGRVMPAGPLRESLEHGLARADAAVIFGADARNAASRIRALRPELAVLQARFAPGPEAARLKGRPALAFAGIGRPEKFFATAREAGVLVLKTADFPDHHVYSDSDLAGIFRRAAALGAVPLTTAKDAARMPPSARAALEVLTMTLVWEDEAALEALLHRFLRSR
ncbi:MAG: tetraacyldisaccharide 4'-kinase [Rhodospirillales bacterium]|nr:tetraacyldisaccharide 4'-kinase [Rhodospirillales bacterium]